jgi:hypothetical protein
MGESSRGAMGGHGGTGQAAFLAWSGRRDGK